MPSLKRRSLILLSLAALQANDGLNLLLAEETPFAFDKIVLQRGFYTEGVDTGDFNNDGQPDVTAGPFIFLGPNFTTVRELYEPKTFDPLKYSDHFLSFPCDMDNDGWEDIMAFGFPGKAAVWYRNPGDDEALSWQSHHVYEGVGNESPTFADVNRDGRPDIVCVTGEQFVWAEQDPSDPTLPWSMHAISEPMGLQRFTHGLGLGDINNDGRVDLMHRKGWFEQPASGSDSPYWIKHDVDFAPGRGGCQMYAVDLTGDGLSEVITSKDGHGYGLSWFEQVKDSAGSISWIEHIILSADKDKAPEGTLFSQLHAMDIGDMDADGLLDIVVGKRWWAHGPAKDPEPNAAAVLYIFRQIREDGTTRFEPHLVDDDSGAGIQLALEDLNLDGKLDIVTANKKGVFAFVSK